MKKLNSNIQLIKYIMAFFIILLHDFTAFGLNNNILFEPIIATSLTIFILLNGFLKVNSKKYNFFSFFILIIVSLLINTILISIFNKTSDINVENILFGGRDWWYIWCYLIVQFFVPYLNKFLINYSKWFTLFIVILFFIACIFVANILHLQLGQMFNQWSLFYFITFYLIGGWIRLWMKIEGMKYFLIYSLLSLTVYISLEIETLALEDTLWNTLSPEILIFSIPLFLTLVSIPSYSNKFVDYLGKISLFIYLFHYIIQTLMIKYIFADVNIVMNIYLQHFLYGFAIFITSSLFASLIMLIAQSTTNVICKQLDKISPYLKIKKAK